MPYVAFARVEQLILNQLLTVERSRPRGNKPDPLVRRQEITNKEPLDFVTLEEGAKVRIS
jgi:hypothetical protein